MRLRGTKRGRKLLSGLRSANRTGFELKCLELLETAFPNIEKSPDGGSLDRAGIDLFTLCEEADQIREAYQCKGFHELTFGASQFSQCKGSLESFKLSSYSCDSYYLVVNRVLKGDYRDRLEKLLNDLVEEGRMRVGGILTPQTLLDFVMKRHLAALSDVLKKSNEKYWSEHGDQMDQEFYLSEISFLSELQKSTCVNPWNNLRSTALQIARQEGNKRMWVFVVSEFGYGKTSFLLECGIRASSEGFKAIYAPIAMFSEQAFSSEWEFLWQLLAIVLEEDIDRNDLRYSLQNSALKELLKVDSEILLLLDGIDEHPAFYREHGLRHMFGCIQIYVSTCVFSVRREYLDDRSRSFNHSLSRTYKHKTDTYTFGEWNDKLIGKYIEMLLTKISGREERDRILEFKGIVASARYEEIYGDIPKRPLFLKMIIDDIRSSGIRMRNLGELYQSYIERKFLRDRDSSVSKPVVSRPGPAADYSKTLADIFLVLSELAASMIEVLKGKIVLKPTACESELEELCGKYGSSIELKVQHLLLNSVIVPAGPRSVKSGRLETKFAHRSFQEFFLAKHIVRAVAECIPSSVVTLLADCQLPQSVVRFARDIGIMEGREVVTALEKCLSGNSSDRS